MIVTTVRAENSNTRGFHVRSDLIGSVAKFDGDHFISDFTRRQNESPSRQSGADEQLERPLR
jgi:hypothetical protein